MLSLLPKEEYDEEAERARRKASRRLDLKKNAEACEDEAVRI